MHCLIGLGDLATVWLLSSLLMMHPLTCTLWPAGQVHLPHLAITADKVHHSSLVVGIEANVEEVPSTRMLGGHHI